MNTTSIGATAASPNQVAAKQANGQASKEAVVIEQIDTSKEGIAAYLKDAGETLKCPPESGKAMRLAVFRFILDSCKITDKAMRGQAWKQFEATHSSFGANASASRQNVLGMKPKQNVFAAMEIEV